MVCNNRGGDGVLGTSWVLITYNICPPVICTTMSRNTMNVFIKY